MVNSKLISVRLYNGVAAILDALSYKSATFSRSDYINELLLLFFKNVSFSDVELIMNDLKTGSRSVIMYVQSVVKYCPGEMLLFVNAASKPFSFVQYSVKDFASLPIERRYELFFVGFVVLDGQGCDKCCVSCSAFAQWDCPLKMLRLKDGSHIQVLVKNMPLLTKFSECYEQIY